MENNFWLFIFDGKNGSLLSCGHDEFILVKQIQFARQSHHIKLVSFKISFMKKLQIIEKSEYFKVQLYIEFVQ